MYALVDVADFVSCLQLKLVTEHLSVYKLFVNNVRWHWNCMFCLQTVCE